MGQLGECIIDGGTLCTCLMSTWLSLVGSRHSHTVPLGLGMRTKLLHYSIILSITKGTIVSSFCNLSNSFLRGSCSA